LLLAQNLNMKTKTFTHNKIEKCRLSKKDIDTETEAYSIILDCVGNEIKSVGFYKTEDLKDLLKGKGKAIQQNFMEKQKQILKNIMGSNPALQKLFQGQEVYEIAN